MAAIAFANDTSGGDVERREQGRHAMARIVVTAPLDLTRAHRQHRLAAVERLDMALLVDAQDQRMLRRRHVEPDNVAHLLNEQWIGRKLEAFRAVRLQAEGSPDAMDGRGRVIDVFGHPPQAPVRGVFWRRLYGQPDRLGALVIADLARPARTGLVQKSVQALLGKSPAPFADCVLDSARAFGDRLVFQPVRRQQDDLRALRQALCWAPAPRQSLKPAALLLAQLNQPRQSAPRTTPSESQGNNNSINYSIGTLDHDAITRNRIMISPL